MSLSMRFEKEKKKAPYPIDSNNKSALCSKDKPMGKLAYFPKAMHMVCGCLCVRIYIYMKDLDGRRGQRES